VDYMYYRYAKYKIENLCSVFELFAKTILKTDKYSFKNYAFLLMKYI